MIEVRITDDMLADGVSVWISRRADGIPRQILHVAEGGLWTEWAVLDQGGADQPAPTIRLTDDEARALLDALLRRYQGASDMHTVRADLLHERGRVDRLVGALIDITERS